MIGKLLKILLDPPKTPNENAPAADSPNAQETQSKAQKHEDVELFSTLQDAVKRADYLIKLSSRKSAKLIIRTLDDVATLEKVIAQPTGDAGVIAEARKRLEALTHVEIQTPVLRAYERLEKLISQVSDKVAAPDWFESFDMLDNLKKQWDNFLPVISQSADFEKIQTRYKDVLKAFEDRVEQNRVIAQARKTWDALVRDFENLDVVRGAEIETQNTLDALRARIDDLPPLPDVYAERLRQRINENVLRVTQSLAKHAEELTRKNDVLKTIEEVIAEIEKVSDSEETRTLKTIQPLLRAFETQLRDVKEFEKDLRARVNASVRKIEARINEVSEQQKAQVKERNDKLTALCEQIEAATAPDLTRENMKEIGAKVDELVGELKALHAFAEDPLVLRFRKAENKFRDARRTMFNYEDQERWANYSVKLRLTESVEAYAKTLDDTFDYRDVSATLKTFREDWKKFGPVPRENSEELWQRFDGACQTIHAWLQPRFAAEDAARAENYEKKCAICEKLEQLVADEALSMKEAQAQFESLLAEFKALGPVPKEQTKPLFERYRAAVGAFTAKRQSFYTQLRERFEQARKTKEHLVSLALTIGDQTWQEGFKIVRDLRQQWKTAGFAGKEHDEKLWNAFNDAVTQFFNNAGKDSDKNGEVKLEICEKLEKIAETCDENANLRNTDNEVKALIEQWRETGPVEREKTAEIVGRFRKALDAWHEKRNTLFAALNAAKESAQKQKEDLITQLDEVLAAELSQNDRADKIKELQTQWKALPLTFREAEDHLRSEFQGRCNAFFADRRESFKKFMDERNENLVRKREICSLLEAMAELEAPGVTDAPVADISNVAKELEFILTHNITAERPTTREDRIQRAIELQNQWSEIGPVPRTESENLFARYRRACDAIFKRPERPEYEDEDGEDYADEEFIDDGDADAIDESEAPVNTPDTEEK